MKEIMETSIFNEVYKIMCSRNYAWNEQMTLSIIRSTMKGMASFLGKKKSKDQPVSVGIYDKNDKMHFAAIVEYVKSESGVDEGSWNISYTFNEDDIDKNLTKIYKIPEDQEARSEISTVAFETEGLFFSFAENNDKNVENDGSPSELITVVFDVVRDYMRANITVDPELNVSNTAKFTAVADTNSKDVLIVVDPDEIIRQLIKDDYANQ